MQTFKKLFLQSSSDAHDKLQNISLTPDSLAR